MFNYFNLLLLFFYLSGDFLLTHDTQQSVCVRVGAGVEWSGKQQIGRQKVVKKQKKIHNNEALFYFFFLLRDSCHRYSKKKYPT